MRRRALKSTVLTSAVAVAGIITGALPPALAQAASVVDPGEATILAEPNVARDAASVISAGETGVLTGGLPVLGRYTSAYHWISYADGSATTVERPAALDGALDTGSDQVVLYGSAGLNGAIELRDPRTGKATPVEVPEGRGRLAVFGSSVLLSGPTAADGLGVATVEDGRTVVRPVTGIPDGAQIRTQVLAHNGNGAIVSYDLDGRRHHVRIDRSGHALTLGVTPLTDGATLAVFGDKVVRTEGGRVSVWGLNGATEPEAERSIDPETDKVVGVQGDELLAIEDVKFRTGWTPPAGYWDRLVAYPLAGGEPRTVVDYVADVARTDSRGRVVVVKAGPEGERALTLVAPGADGRAAGVKFADVPKAPTKAEFLTAGQGRITSFDRRPGVMNPQMRSVDLSVSGRLTPGRRTDRGEETFAAQCNGGSGRCTRLFSTGSGQVVYQVNGRGPLHFVADGEGAPGRTLAPAGLDDLRSVSGRYAAYTGAAKLSVVDLETGAQVVNRPLTDGGYALWGNTLYTVQPGEPGRIAVEQVGGKPGKPFSVAGCRLSDLQAVAARVYWSCADQWRAGVYDTRTGVNTTVPFATQARLGDGYVVSASIAGKLTLTDVTGAKPVSRELGTAAAANAGSAWDVDRFGGAAVYQDAEGDTHAVPSRAPRSALAVIDADVRAKADKSARWAPRFWLSKPAASWSLALKDKAGATVRTLTGGEARGLVNVRWDGKDGNGRQAAPGAYTWTLTAKPADGEGAELTRTGALAVDGATAWHDRTADGIGDLLAISGSGSLDVWKGTGTGRVTGKVAGAGFGTSARAVSFGDSDKNGCGDVLVRMADGELRNYRGGCGAPLVPASAHTTAGTGFGGFDVLTSPGDLNGDGLADLVGRTSGGDLYVYAGRADGKLAGGVKIGSGWKSFTHIVGVGDLDGDGSGDLVARRNDGTLFRYDGNGAGRLKSAVKVADGWGADYDLIASPGDLDGDGKADLVARDKTGALYRLSGLAGGAFGTPEAIGTGWSGMKSLS
ncbi:FG-GAP-like repeat-containing protein [Streptomyces sp. NPDC001941]|uniref:FG-GAP-like repeat-containing protein n=1 Tax=Streptomyces sp. NPDC001941 TaxID=3154659 RepID=UPI00332BF753